MSIEHIINLEKMVEQTIDINDIFDWDYLGWQNKYTIVI
jgi:hypothetical protein